MVNENDVGCNHNPMGGELHWLPGYWSGTLILAGKGKLKILVLFAGHDTKSNVSENRIICPNLHKH